MKILLVIFYLLFPILYLAQDITIIESSDEFIRLKLNFENKYFVKDTTVNGIYFNFIKENNTTLRNPGEPWLPVFGLNLGIPENANPELLIISDNSEIISNKLIIPFPDQDSSGLSEIRFSKEIYNSNKYFPSSAVNINEQFKFRFANISPVEFNPFQYNPITRELIFHKEIEVKIRYKNLSVNSINKISSTPVNDKLTDDYLKTSVINYESAKKWMRRNASPNQLGKTTSESDSKNPADWYNPAKTYFKIYVKSKGVYTVAFDELLSAGFPSDRVLSDKIEIYHNGNLIPIKIFDNGDKYFDSGDYLQFIGSTPSASPYSTMNLYNNENIYWLSYEADSAGYYYKDKSGFPDKWDRTLQVSYSTVHFEVDSIYERLGLAPDGKRDYWYWGKASGRNGSIVDFFTTPFSLKDLLPDSSKMKLRAKLHGMTNLQSVYPDHNVEIMLTSQPVGKIQWDGQTDTTFEAEFDLKNVGIFSTNNFQVVVRGNIPGNTSDKSDEIRVNWFEIDYWRENRVNGKYYNFINHPNLKGKNRYSLWQWQSESMSIYIPEKGICLVNPQNTTNQYKEWLFTDSTNTNTEYFCVADDYVLSPDSIVKNISSDLRNKSNGADYIIIAHPDFKQAAEKLANYRSNNLSGFSNPRIKIVYIQDIYNEFSFGLLDPYAIRDFISYAFNNWESPSPVYIVLLGDMSWDYRRLVAGSRKNFIPSIPYHAGGKYGQAVSDNMFAAINGNDVVPDLAIGRLSCETAEEANILVDKIINYPSDHSKNWKEKILLISAGESLTDENLFGFNYETIKLEKNFLIPAGYTSKKVIRYVSKPEYEDFFGERPEIREAFNQGTVFANFYGHGGGYQWDFVFLNDDIYLLQNENRLPVISSITCYTAHFDNQNVFGEQFNKVPGKGSIGFWGHTGVTIWLNGVDLNNKLYHQIFSNKKYIIGDAILFAKSMYTSFSSNVKDHIALLTYLGDPALEMALPQKPDFSINSTDISVTPAFPLINDTAAVKVKIQNLGRSFPGDSISVSLYATYIDSTFLIGKKKLGSFGQTDSISFDWPTKRAGAVNLKVEVNESDIIEEDDHNDNSATIPLIIYSISEPNVIKPYNGLTTPENKIKFLLADIGYYISKSLIYFIEIDTIETFVNPIIISEAITPSNGLAEWNSPVLTQGKYFWRAKLYDNTQFSNWTPIQTFSIEDDKPGYYVSGKQLKLFNLNNVIYSDSLNNLILNTALLPPKPRKEKVIEDISITLPGDVKGLSTFTTDGSYIYFGHIAYYGGPTKIYKMGTGYNGTEKRKIYGAISNIKIPVWHQMFYHSDGYIYIPAGDAHTLIRMNPQTGDTSSINIPDGLINSGNSRVVNGSFYLTSDGKYVYNIATFDTTGKDVYTIRIFNPADNWKKIKDVHPSGSSYLGFSGFFVARNYCYAYENYMSGFLRKIDLVNEEFKDEWLSNSPFQGYYAWSYDWTNDVVYASVYRSGKSPKFTKFAGTYKEAHGSIISQEVGPSSLWKELKFDLDTKGTTGKYSNILEGYNSNLKRWDIIAENIPSQYLLDKISPDKYHKLRMVFNFVDSSFGASEPIKLSSLNITYENLPEIVLNNKNLSFSPDSLLQGFPISMEMKITNFGYTTADSLKVNFYLDDNTTAFQNNIVSIPADSSVKMQYTIPTENLIFSHKVTVLSELSKNEMFTFNNVISNSFFVVRDSINPSFNITFDGIEIINGDIVSSRPEIIMTLKDNSPLPLSDTSRFYIFHNSEPVSFKKDSLKFNYSAYPNSQATINWKPEFSDGTHSLDILAKDASGNYFDSSAYSISFNVSTENDLTEVFNYPNPFSDITHFTFNLTGTELPIDVKIKIFTVAGRKVREINVPVSQLRFGFNKILYDGRDQDGNALANGVYFYKFVVRHNNNFRTVIQKLAKIK